MSFASIQATLPSLWRKLSDSTSAPKTVLALPSISLTEEETVYNSQLNRFEERILYLLNHLKNPNCELILLLSQPVPESVLSYYLYLLPGVPFSHARKRLTVLFMRDSSSLPLCQKVLERPVVMRRLKNILAGRENAYIASYTVTELEKQLVESLGIPIVGMNPESGVYESKSRARALMREAGLTCADGVENINSQSLLREALLEYWNRPNQSCLFLKWNHTMTGLGVATLATLGDDDWLQSDHWLEQLGRRLRTHPKLNSKRYLNRYLTEGGIVEVGLEGKTCSVQLWLDPGGTTRIVATHDELLGGEAQWSYRGCFFPAEKAHSKLLVPAGRALASVCQKIGVLGRVDLDCIAVFDGKKHVLFGIDLNFRKGNTIFPIRTLEMLSGSRFDEDTYNFFSSQGHPQSYFSSDSCGDGSLKGLTAHDILDLSTVYGDHYESFSGRGCVLHMLGSASRVGSVGLTYVEPTPAQAYASFQRFVQYLEDSKEDSFWIE